MPPIYLHMVMARDLGETLASQILADERGAYLLGATTPDIRVLTRWERERTHYFDLGNLEHQDSVASFLSAHPELAAPERLTPATVAFVAGYLSHLALDETYIQQVYRPHFGQRSALGGDLSANTMDRMLQYELERLRREDPATAEAIRTALAGSSLSLDVGFLDREMLERWLEVVTDQTRHPADWERFRHLSRRHLSGLGIESDEEWERFRESIPSLLQRTIDHVSTAQVDAFLEQATERARAAIRQYLGAGA
jgi:hypothetical protein